MKLVLEINNPQKMAMLLELLRSLDFVEKVQVASEANVSQPANIFDRYYGSAKTGMSMDEIDAQLDEMRREWERDI